MLEEREILVTFKTTQESFVDDVVDLIKNEYVKDEDARKCFYDDIADGEYSGLFTEFINAFIRHSDMCVYDENKEHRLAKVKITDFCMDELSFCVSDIVDSMDSLSGKYASLFSLLEFTGYDYESDSFDLPELVLVEDLAFDTSDIDDMNITVKSIFPAVSLFGAKERKNKLLVAYFVTDEVTRAILNEMYFSTVGNSDLMYKIYDRTSVEAKILE